MDTFGLQFRVTLFGESHGPALGVTVDGIPAGVPVSPEDFIDDISRRSPSGKGPGATSRRESDVPEILSGVYNGCTTGAPLTVIFRNEDMRPGDYSLFEEIPRPGHADFTASVKYNYFNDIRGGGHFSGRLTLPLVAAGVIAKAVLNDVFKDTGGCLVSSHICEIGGYTSETEINELLEDCIRESDSVGGVVECRVKGLAAGVGEPFFDSVESVISHAVFSVPGIRGIEFGDGFASARMRGSEHNDPYVDSAGHTAKNGAGGVNGGISNGNEIVFRVAVKPASSIGRPQSTYNFVTESMDVLEIPGRHDCCIALRVPVVIEAVTAISLADLVLRGRIG